MNWKIVLALLLLCFTSVTAFADKQTPAPTIEPVQFSDYLFVGEGTLANGKTFSYLVPDGKRLVIEYISVEVRDLAAGDSVAVSIFTTVNETAIEHYLGVAEPMVRPIIDPSSQSDPNISKQVKLYADGGTNISLFASRLTRINSAIVDYSFSGYLVSVK